MTFKIGEIAILQHAVNFPELNGEEVEIVGTLDNYEITVGGVRSGEFRYSYRVKLVNRSMPANLAYLLPAPHQLRKKRPPEDEDARDRNTVVPWSECAWKPAGVTA